MLKKITFLKLALNILLIFSPSFVEASEVCRKNPNADFHFLAPYRLNITQEESHFQLNLEIDLQAEPCRDEIKRDPHATIDGPYQLEVVLYFKKDAYDLPQTIDRASHAFTYTFEVADPRKSPFTPIVHIPFTVERSDLNSTYFYTFSIELQKIEELFGFIPMVQKRFFGRISFSLFSDLREEWHILRSPSPSFSTLSSKD